MSWLASEQDKRVLNPKELYDNDDAVGGDQGRDRTNYGEAMEVEERAKQPTPDTETAATEQAAGKGAEGGEEGDKMDTS